MNFAIARPGLSLCFLAATTSAFSAPDQSGLGGAIQQQIEKQLPKPNPLPAPGPDAVPQQEAPREQSDVKVLVKSFSVEGAAQISDAEIQDVLSQWTNKPLAMIELQDAADAVAKLYNRKGLLAKTFFPPQKIKDDGVVILKVVEAKLGLVKIETEGQSIRLSKEIAAAYITNKNQSGDLVNTKKIEDAIALLSELPGVSIKTELRPSETEGEVDLYVSVADKPLVSGGLIAGNYGNASTGTLQGLVNTHINNPSGLGDLIALNGMHTQGLWFGKLGWYLPLGVSGLKAGIDYSSMRYKTVGNYAGNDGDSSILGLNLTYPLLRSTTTNFNASLSYDIKNYKNNHVLDAQAAPVVLSDYSVKDLSATFSGNHYDSWGLGGVTNFSLSFTDGNWRSNTWSDANSPSNYGQYTSRNFKKINFSANRNQQILEDEVILSATLSGQFTNVNLDSVEKFYLGGANGVRAYPSAQGAGDEGVMLNVQLEQQLYEGLTGFAFYDYGQVRQYKDSSTYNLLVPANTTNAPNGYSLSGAGIGVRYGLSNVTLNGSVAWPMGKNPLYAYSTTANAYVPQNNDGKSQQPYIWLQATYKF